MPSSTYTPHLLNQTVMTVVDQALRSGMTRGAAARRAGITPTTFNRWYERGQLIQTVLEHEQEGDPIPIKPDDPIAQMTHEDKEKYLAFFNMVNTAEAADMEALLQPINTAGHNGDWKAAAWRLERRYPGDYGKPDPNAAGGQNNNIGITVIEVNKATEPDAPRDL